MLDIQKILLPVDFPITSLDVIHQAAALACHFNSKIVILHVLTASSRAAGTPGDGRELAGRDLLPSILREAQRQLDTHLERELDGLDIRCVLVEGDPARTIVQMAEEEEADLIMMPSHGSTFEQFLLGSVTAKVLHRTECPLWTGAHVEASPVQKFSVRNVLCAVDFGPVVTSPCRGQPK